MTPITFEVSREDLIKLVEWGLSVAQADAQFEGELTHVALSANRVAFGDWEVYADDPMPGVDGDICECPAGQAGFTHEHYAAHGFAGAFDRAARDLVGTTKNQGILVVRGEA